MMGIHGSVATLLSLVVPDGFCSSFMLKCISWATEHTFRCHGQFNWIHPKTIARENNYRKRKIPEAPKIMKVKYNKKLKALNRDLGNLIKANADIPKLANINEMLAFWVSQYNST